MFETFYGLVQWCQNGSICKLSADNLPKTGTTDLLRFSLFHHKTNCLSTYQKKPRYVFLFVGLVYTDFEESLSSYECPRTFVTSGERLVKQACGFLFNPYFYIFSSFLLPIFLSPSFSRILGEGGA